MSFYRATIVFNDNQQLYVDITEKDLKKFSEDVSNNKIFWNNEQSQGFWTDIKNIRYISFKEKEADSNELPVQSNSDDEKKGPQKTKGSSKNKN